MKSETALQNEIRLAVGKLKDTRLFRNNVGMINGVQFGLCVGSSDLIGFQSVTVTSEMVGQKIAVFTALEVKTQTGKASEPQTKFLSMVKKFGGIGAVVRSVDDAVELLKIT
ncbi:MAG: VRR-NUC domain-containing protein [Methylococcales bacterium]|nr:VRR-NUC domain-containing protein [Methylococcales bacterium]